MGFFADHSADGTYLTYRLFRLDLRTAPATISAGISPGTRTVTPSSMTGIATGVVLDVWDADGGATEQVTVTGTSPTTFTAVFTLTHAGGWLVDAPDVLFMTDCDVDIETGSGDPCGAHTWAASSIETSTVSSQPSGAVAEVVVGDAGGTLFAKLDFQNGGELCPAALYEAGFLVTNKTPTPDEVLQLFAGNVDRSVFSTQGKDTVDIVLMPPAQLDTVTVPTRLVASLVRVT